MAHCSDNTKDRKIGKLWERNFCKEAAQYNKAFTPMQIGRSGSAQAYTWTKGADKWNPYTLPDVTVWTYPGEHHEIKHKNPTPRNQYGLEVYRFDALLWFAKETQQSVMYTIHDWQMAGGKDRPSKIEHWVMANVLSLNNNWTHETDKFPSWIDGQKKANVPQYFWSIDLWTPLTIYWGVF